MNYGTRVLLALIIMGTLLACAGFSETKMLFNGKTVDITDPVSSFDEPALVQGDIDFVVGPFAILETTHKTYGITTSTDTTDYFIVSNLKNGTAAVVMSVSNNEMKAQLEAAADKWDAWMSGEDESEDPPDINISFKGKLHPQNGSSEYLEYYQVYERALVECEWFSLADFAFLSIVEGEVGMTSPILCIGGAALAVISLIILIVSKVRAKKRESIEEYY